MGMSEVRGFLCEWNSSISCVSWNSNYRNVYVMEGK